MMLFAACLLIFEKKYVIAAPAALTSASSDIYETADENSNVVGSLVQGNTFELLETITAENGETWYLVSIGNGIQGYMKGEISTEAGNPAPAPDAGAEAEAGENGEADAAAGENGEAEAGEEALPESEDDAGPPDAALVNRNTQKKTYSVTADAERIRALLPPDDETQASPAQLKVWNVDKALLLLLCAALFSAILLIKSCHKLKQIVSGSQARLSAKSCTEKHRARKRKRRRSKKAKRKRAAKEAKRGKTTVHRNRENCAGDDSGTGECGNGSACREKLPDDHTEGGQ